MAVQEASTIPSPSQDTETSSPSTRITKSADGVLTLPPRTSRLTNS